MRSYSVYKLFDLSITHSYFEKGMCKCLLIQPTAETKQIMDQYKFKMNSFESGFGLYGTNVGNLSTLFGQIANTTHVNSFDFTINSTDPAFYNFTDIPLDGLTQINFDSKSINIESENKTIALLPQYTQAVTVTNTCKVSIYFNDLLTLSSLSNTPAFVIGFNARQTQWHYFIVSTNIKNISQIKIKSREQIQFEAPVVTSTPRGEMAFLFTTGTTLLPFSEKPQYKFDLVYTNGWDEKSAGKILFKGLPNPDPMRMNISTLNGVKQINSPIYIYL